MATDEKSEEDLLALDDTEVNESKNGNEDLDSKEEDKLLSNNENESDVEYIPEIEDKDISDPKNGILSNPSQQQASTNSSCESVTLVREEEENIETSCTVSDDQSSLGQQNDISLRNENSVDVDSDEDIVEIAVIKSSANTNQQIQNTLGIGSSNLQAERLRRAREEERNRLLQREKVSEFNFRSNRLQQQRKRVRYNTDGRPMIYADDFEFCDCLQLNCPGCHYPCKSCGDCRCGHECRVNRRYVYESIELEGRNITLKTPKSTTKSTS